jgi:hypothetical protein
LAGFILLLSREFIIVGTRFHLDTPMLFFILLSFVMWWKNKPILTGIAAGLGIWFKGPVALLIFPSAFLALCLTRTMTLTAFKKLILSSLIALLLGSLIWFITGAIGGWHLPVDYFKRQVWGTAVGGRGDPGHAQYYMLIDMLITTYYPWILLLITSLLAMLVKKRWKQPSFALIFSAAVVVGGVITMIKFKHHWYFVPIFPFLALLCLDPLESWINRYSNRIHQVMIGFGLIVPVFLLANPIELGPENFPALRRFSAIIQSYGNCDHSVLFVEGGQPFGTELNSLFTLKFYTQRKLLEATCQNANQILTENSPEWVIVTDPNDKNCLQEKFMAHYPIHYRVGNQLLFALEKMIPQDRAGDLTPLDRELKPVLDCRSVPLKKTPYTPY